MSPLLASNKIGMLSGIDKTTRRSVEIPNFGPKASKKATLGLYAAALGAGGEENTSKWAV